MSSDDEQQCHFLGLQLTIVVLVLLCNLSEPIIVDIWTTSLPAAVLVKVTSSRAGEKIVWKPRILLQDEKVLR